MERVKILSQLRMREINFPEDFDMENLENQVLLNFIIKKKVLGKGIRNYSILT